MVKAVMVDNEKCNTSICPMKHQKLYLHRTRICERTCDGRLYDELGNHICDTAESTPYRLPAGEYPFVPSTMLSRTNGVYALRDGTILVGTHCVPGVVIRTADAYNRLRKRINEARRRGKSPILVITESVN